jgi:hypothetical protein
MTSQLGSLFRAYHTKKARAKRVPRGRGIGGGFPPGKQDSYMKGAASYHTLGSQVSL